MRQARSGAGHKRRRNRADGSVRQPWPASALWSRAAAVVMASTTWIVTDEIVLKRVPILYFSIDVEQINVCNKFNTFVINGNVIPSSSDANHDVAILEQLQKQVKQEKRRK